MAEPNPQAGDTGPPKGIPALKAHVSANKIDVALWAIRVMTVLCTIGYVLPLFNNATSAFYKALIANAATSALRLHQRIPPREIALSREFVARLFVEDSAHYLFYSLIFMNVVPNLLILAPIFLFALLHAASYSLTILDMMSLSKPSVSLENSYIHLLGMESNSMRLIMMRTLSLPLSMTPASCRGIDPDIRTLGPNSLWALRLVISLIEFQSRNILRVAALAEIMLFPVVALMALFGNCGLMTPLVYYYFVTWRYASRRNPYTRNTFRELRALADGAAQRPSLPAAARAAITSAVALVCRMAPPLQHLEQQQQ